MMKKFFLIFACGLLIFVGDKHSKDLLDVCLSVCEMAWLIFSKTPSPLLVEEYVGVRRE